MALFKVSKGTSRNLPTELTEGYCWYTYDDSKFYIDYKDDEDNLVRKAINAEDAATLCGMSLEELRKSISWNDLLDRPFSEETIEPITWNGVVGDRATFVRDGFTFVKVSDGVLTKDQFSNGATFIFSDDSDTYITDMYVLDEGTGIHIFMYAYSFREPCEIDGITIPEAGTYFALGSTGYHVQALTFPSVIKTIDEKYLPNTLARVSDIVQADWSETYDDSMAYIRNKPFGDFYQIKRTGDETVTVTGKYTTFTLVSNDILEYEELSGVAIYSGASGSFPSLTRFSDNAYGTYSSILVITQDDTTCSQVSNNPFPNAGVYLGSSTEYAVLQVKKLPEKYIPSKFETTESVQVKIDEATANLASKEYVDSKQVQSDWSVNDPENPAYVQNRPMCVLYETELCSISSEEYQAAISEDKAGNNYECAYIEIPAMGNTFDNYYLEIDGVDYLEVNADKAMVSFTVLDAYDVNVYYGKDKTWGTSIATDLVEIYYNRLPENPTSIKIKTKVLNYEYENLMNPHFVARRSISMRDSRKGEIGVNSVAFGYNNEVSGDYGFAAGSGNTVTAEGSALGMKNKVTARNGVALGMSNEVNKQHSVAEGTYNIANATASHVEGTGNIASSSYQHVQGQYNIEDANNQYAHIVGNGQNNSTRSNAHTLDWSGNAWFAGDVKVGGTGQYDVNAKTLATTDDLSWDILKDKPFYDSDNITFFDSTIITSDIGGVYGFLDQGDIAKTIPALIEGKTYTVTFNNDVYTCICYSGTYLGNLSLLSIGNDTNEPFVVIIQNGLGFGVATTDTASATHTIKIEGQAIKTIDEKYLPKLPYVTLQEGSQYWVDKSDFAQTNSNLIYKGQSYMTNHNRFMFFLTSEGIWNINLVVYDSAQTPAMSSFRMNYASSDGTLSFYWKDESNATEITTRMHAYLYDVNTGNIIRRESSVQSVTIGAYTKKSHNVDFYINKNNPQPAEIVRSFDDYVEVYSQDEVDALLSSMKPKYTTVTIPASNWIGTNNPWSQAITINGVTANSKIDLQPTALQIVSLQNDEIALMLQNDSGVVTAWAIGNKPTEDYTMQVLITEVTSV